MANLRHSFPHLVIKAEVNSNRIPNCCLLWYQVPRWSCWWYSPVPWDRRAASLGSIPVGPQIWHIKSKTWGFGAEWQERVSHVGIIWKRKKFPPPLNLPSPHQLGNPFLFLEVISWMVLPHLEEAGGSKEPRAFPVEQSVCEDSPSDWLGLCPASATHQLSEPRWVAHL